MHRVTFSLQKGLKIFYRRRIKCDFYFFLECHQKKSLHLIFFLVLSSRTLLELTATSTHRRESPPTGFAFQKREEDFFLPGVKLIKAFLSFFLFLTGIKTFRLLELKKNLLREVESCGRGEAAKSISSL